MSRTVSPFESKLIRITRALVGRLSLAEALPLLVRREKPPKCLSRNCVELVENTLSVGLTEQLARMGWEPQRTQRGESVVSGRLWERCGPAERSLAFSSETMKWLIWLTSENFAEPHQKLKLRPSRFTLGDEVLRLQAMLVLHQTPGVGTLLSQAGFRSHGLIALLFPDTRAEQRISKQPEMAPWLQPDRAWVTETIAPLLTRRWARIEQAKRQSADLTFLRGVSGAQQQILDLFLDEITRTGRWDLARWLLSAAAEIQQNVPAHERYFPRIRSQGLRMAERSMLCEQGLVLLRVLERLQEHHRQTQAIGFYDEGYQISQLWKSDWERLGGETICRQAAELVQRNLPLRLGSGGENDP